MRIVTPLSSLKKESTQKDDLNAVIVGKNVTIESKAASGVGIWLQNGTQEAIRPDGATNLKINAQNLKVTANQGIIAYSNSGLDITGNTEINSEVAIVARGNSVVNINKECQACKTIINGDIAFMTTNTPSDSTNSGNLINAELNLNFSGTESQWNGRAYQTFKDESGEFVEIVDLDNLRQR